MARVRRLCGAPLGPAVCGLLLYVCAPLSGWADPIIWLGHDAPPADIAFGPDQGQGYGDALIDATLHALSRYEIRRQEVPVVREVQLMVQGPADCSRDLMRTSDREDALRFTAPFGYVLPVGLIIRTSDQARIAPYLTDAQTVSLRALMRGGGFVLGLAQRRHYGNTIDPVIASAQAAAPNRMISVYEDNGTDTLVKMLGAHHIDAVLAYPSEAYYLARRTQAPDQYHAYALTEAPPLISTRFSCTRNSATDSVFAALEAQARSAPVRNINQSNYERWLPPNLLPLYRERLKHPELSAN